MLKRTKILFFSRGDATRSLMAQGFLQSFAADRFLVSSTAVEPGSPNPIAIDVMKEVGVDISAQESHEVAQVLKEHFGYVITVCDLAKERAPIFPFTFHLLHWSVMDPAVVKGTHRQTRDAFRRVRNALESNVRFFLNGTVEKEQERGVLIYA